MKVLHEEVVPLEISLDNVSFTAAGLLFQYTATEPTVLIPDRGSMEGGGNLTIQGHNLHGGSHYVCAFDELRDGVYDGVYDAVYASLSPASYDATRDEVRCVAPRVSTHTGTAGACL